MKLVRVPFLDEAFLPGTGIQLRGKGKMSDVLWDMEEDTVYISDGIYQYQEFADVKFKPAFRQLLQGISGKKIMDIPDEEWEALVSGAQMKKSTHRKLQEDTMLVPVVEIGDTIKYSDGVLTTSTAIVDREEGTEDDLSVHDALMGEDGEMNDDFADFANPPDGGN